MHPELLLKSSVADNCVVIQSRRLLTHTGAQIDSLDGSGWINTSCTCQNYPMVITLRVLTRPKIRMDLVSTYQAFYDALRLDRDQTSLCAIVFSSILDRKVLLRLMFTLSYVTSGDINSEKTWFSNHAKQQCVHMHGSPCITLEFLKQDY